MCSRQSPHVWLCPTGLRQEVVTATCKGCGEHREFINSYLLALERAGKLNDWKNNIQLGITEAGKLLAHHA